MKKRKIEAVAGTIGKIVGHDMTGNRSMRYDAQSGFASAPTRNLSISVLLGVEQIFGDDTDFSFGQGEEGLPEETKDAATFFNTRQDLLEKLPSTRKVNRWNAQNKE